MPQRLREPLQSTHKLLCRIGVESCSETDNDAEELACFMASSTQLGELVLTGTRDGEECIQKSNCTLF